MARHGGRCRRRRAGLPVLPRSPAIEGRRGRRSSVLVAAARVRVLRAVVGVSEMTGRDREALIKLTRQRARHAKAEANQRATVLLVEVDDRIDRRCESARRDCGVGRSRSREEYAAKANDQIQPPLPRARHPRRRRADG